ncbi:Dipeptidase A [Salinivirga cyanobacteriivorans]|uniref:Dipeptidase n=1 Tax=Salinivirga cyanobacteriivorans TaxID=1307839 RepID=A0A0S2HX28_9BACT|nr:C69 family dipeptidase [Salinivirga cyanobacteriivorans]ALO14627.1 Dipeptidase A [Salinivirga cyanobacteriivorans]
MKNFIRLLTISFLLFSIQSHACTIIAVGKKASKDGSNIISHSDAGPDSRIFVVPAMTFEEGAKAPVYWGIQDATLPLDKDGEILGYIPQIRQTYKYFHSAYSQVNEYQLGIAESTTAQRDELICTRKNGEQIMTIEQAQIFALQRHKTAREAVKFIGELMTKYGFLPSSGPGSETLVIADKDEIWVLEIFGVGAGWTRDSGKPGAIWAAQRLPEDQATMVPNWSIIKQIDEDDKDNFMVSDNYKQEAIDRGWYNPESGKLFIWQEAYAPLPAEYATGRFWLFHQTFAPNLKNWPDRSVENNYYKGMQPYFQTVEPVSYYPFSIQPEKKMSVQDVISFQRSTFEGTIYDMTLYPQWMVPDGEGSMVQSPMATPFPDSEMRKAMEITYRRPVARHRGHYGMVLQIRDWLPDEIGGVYWVYLDNPYFCPYIPIYTGNLSVDESYKTYDPEAYSEKSARWAYDFVGNLCRLRFQPMSKDVIAKRDPFEQNIFDKQAEIEKEALKLHKKKPEKAQEFLTEYTNGLMQEATQMYIELRNQLITDYTNNHE